MVSTENGPAKSDDPFSIHLSPSNRYLATLEQYSLITVYDLANNSSKKIETSFASQLYFSDDESFLVLNCGNAVKNYSLLQQSWSKDILASSDVHQNLSSIYKCPFSVKLMVLDRYELVEVDSFNGK